jgi:hypothetical protein
MIGFAGLTGCDDMLDVTPGSDMTDDGFWKSENDLKGACNRLYQQLSWASHDTRADDQIGKSINLVSSGGRTVQDASESDWKDPYDRIFLANNIIEKSGTSTVAEEVRNHYIAEARFFRAYYHFDLVCKYGDVPLVTKVFISANDPDIKMPRTPREQVVEQCYQDLEFAAEHLPTRAKWTTTDEFDRRRVTRSSALGLMVRIGLYEGTYQKYHAGKAYNKGGGDYKAHLKKAIDAFNLLDKEGHSLYTTGGAKAYQDLFFEEDQAKNKEIIFGKAYGPNGGSGTGYTNHSYSGDSEGSYALTRKMVELYLYADGLPQDKTELAVEDETSFNTILGFENDGTEIAGGEGARDPRLALSVWRIGDPQQDNWALSGKGASGKYYLPFDSQRPFGYQLKKAFDGARWGASRDYTDRFIIRWGEMLISYAEALYEHDGSITDDVLDKTVNALRARVGFEVKLTNDFVNENGLDMLTEIRRERTVELMAENRRYDDLVRWKTAETELPQAILGGKYISGEGVNVVDTPSKLNAQNLYIFETSDSRKFNPARDYLYPVPQYEIVHSDGNVTQNPEWQD